MADMIKFYKGLLASLPTTGDNGAIYITSDEGGIYLGTGTGMKRLGDFIQVDSVSSLPVSGASTSALYYCVAENILAKWNNSQWVQINKQKTLAELGGVAQSVYDAKIAALETADSKNATAIENLKGYVGTIPTGATATDIVGYVQEKTTGIATSANLEEIGARVTTAEGDIDAIETAIDKIKDGTNIDSFADVEAKLAEKVDKVTGKSLVSDTEITKLAGITAGANKVEASSTNGKIKIDGVETVVYTHPENHTISEITGLQAAIDDAKKAGTDAQTDVDALEAKVGTVADGKTVVQMISEAQTAATYDDKAVKDRIAAIENDYLKSTDKTTLETAIAAAKKAGDDAQADIDAFLAAAEVGDAAIDTLKEIQDYIENDGAAATEMTSKISALETTVGGAESGLVKDVADNAAAITAEKGRAEAAENALDARLDALEEIDHSVYAQTADVTTSQSAQDTKIDANTAAIATLNGTGDGSVSKKISDAITNVNLGQYAKQADLDTAKENIEGLEAKAHEHANKLLLDSYTQTEVDLADAVAKRHSHTNATVLNGITADNVSSWNSAQTNAKTYTDTTVNSAKGELTTAINAKANATDVYQKSQTYTQAEVNELLTWGSF